MSNELPPLILELRARAGQAISEIGRVGSSVKKLDKETEGGLSGSKKAFTGLAGVGKAALFGIGGAALVVGGASLKLGMDFQEATTQLVTGAGESEENLKMVRSGLIQMAPAVGMGPEALAKAMFLVESAGYHGADGLKVMKAAAEGAKIGGADATVVANGLTTALTDYHLSAAQAGTVTSQLIATVAAGKTNMQDLSGSLSAVLPAASAAHIGLAQVLGAMGTMTGEGISAQQASQDLAGTIRSLGNPSAVASKAMAQMGLNSTTVAQQLGKKGLTGTLAELTSAITSHMGPAGLVLQSSFNQSQLAAQSANQMLSQLPKSLQGLARGYLNGTVTQKEWMADLKTQPALVANLGKQFATEAKSAHGFSDSLKSGSGSAKTFNAIMSDMTGGATGLSTALALSGGNMSTFKGNVDAIGNAATEAGGHVKGWAETQKDFQTQMAQAKAGVEAMGVKIGMALIPIVQKAIQIGTQWTDWLMKHKPVLITLAAVIGGALVIAIGAYIVSMAAAAIATIAATWPILAIIAAVVAVGVGIYELAKHWTQVWGDIKKWTADVAHAVGGFFERMWKDVSGFAKRIWGDVSGFFVRIWNDLYRFSAGIWHDVTGFFGRIVSDIVGGFQGMINWIGAVPAALGRIFTGMFDGLIQAGKDAFNWVANAWNDTVGSLSFKIPSWVPVIGGAGFSMPQIPTFANGGQLNLSGWNVVGEAGAELVGPGGKVYSNRDSSKMLAGSTLGGGGRYSGSGASLAAGGGGTTVLESTTNVYLDSKKIQTNVERKYLQQGSRRVTAYQGNRR